MRAMDSTGILSDWTSGHFHLPSHDITTYADGTASLAVDIDDLSDNVVFIEDTVCG